MKTMKMKVKFMGVDWDADRVSIEESGLKRDFIENVEIYVSDNADDDEIADALSDWLSDEFGYCHNGFDFEILD